MSNLICFFFIFLTEAMILWQYASRCFTAKSKPATRIVVLCGLYLILFVAALFESKWLNIILYLTTNFIFLSTQYCLNWYSAFFHSSMLTAIMMTCELIVYYSIIYFMPQFFTKNKIHNLSVFAICSKLIFFTAVSIILHLYFLKKQHSREEQHNKSVFFLILIPVTSLFVMLTFVKISDSSILSPALNWMITLSTVFLLVINLLVFGVNQYNQKKNLEFTEMQLLLQKEANAAQYYEMMLLQNENQSILIHDIKKHLQSIDMLNSQNEREKISAYIHQLMKSSNLKEVSRLCDNEMLNMVLSRYQRECMDRHIAFHADIRKGTLNDISDSDITSLFCNLLDNAVEAADGIPDAFIEVSTGRREKTPFVVITVINSSRKNPFFKQTDKLNSSKKDKSKHGFGIKSIRKTISKYYGDMQMYYSNDSLTFHTIITLKQST